MESSDQQMIITCLSSHSIFHALSTSEKNEILAGMFYCTVDAGKPVFAQNDKAHSYFVIHSGEVDVIINDSKKKTLKKG